MIIEPLPTNPKAPWRRALQLAGIVTPAILLVVVVGAGVLGPKPVPAPTAPPPSIAAAVTGAPSPSLDAHPPATGLTGQPQPADQTTPPVDQTPPPADFAGFHALAVSDVLDARIAGRRLGFFAIDGWLAIPAVNDGCTGGTLGPIGPWCERSGILADVPWSGLRSTSTTAPSHIHVTIPVGVRAPSALEGATHLVAGAPVRVLVLGRFPDDGVPCAGSNPGACEHGFIVERVAWANGARTGLTPLVAERLDTERRANPFITSVATSEVPLTAVFDWPDQLGNVDPAAATVARSGTASQPLWYLRTYDVKLHAIRWRLLAERDLHVLASGGETLALTDSSVMLASDATLGYPVAFAGLAPVLPSVAIARRPSVAPAAPFVVMGLLKVDPPDGSCTGSALGPLGAWCIRHGVLADRTWTGASGPTDGLTAHLRVTLPVGVTLPAALARTARTSGAPLPVVVAGRFTGRPCAPPAPVTCEQAFTIDRIGWVAGNATTAKPVVDARLATHANAGATGREAAAVSIASGKSGTVLVSALVRATRLSAVDPDAAAAVARAGAPARRVWYVRVLETSYGSILFPPGDTPARVSWLVLDDATGRVLAWGVA